jgi:catalase-peroxidase
MLDIKDDKTDTQTHDMTGRCPFGGDRVGASWGHPPRCRIGTRTA